MDKEYEITRLAQDEEESLAEFLTEEGYKENVAIAKVCLKYEHCHIYCYKDKSGKLISICAISIFAKEAGIIHMYLTRTSCRGQGHGKKVFSRCLKLGEQLQYCGLVAEPHNFGMYAKSGFLPIGTPTWTMVGKIKDKLPVETIEKGSIKISKLDQTSLDNLLAFDDKIQPFSRHSYIQNFVETTNLETIIAKDEHGHCVGFGCLHFTGFGYNLQPLYAINTNTFKCLISEILKLTKREYEVTIYVPTENKESLKYFKEALDLSKEPEFGRRLYKGATPVIDTTHIYCVLDNAVC